MSIRRYESNERKPPVNSIESIAIALEVTPSYLVGYDEKANFADCTPEEISDIQNQVWEIYRNNETESENLDQGLIAGFSLLNKDGKRKIIEYINDLTDIKRYREIPNKPNTKDPDKT